MKLYKSMSYQYNRYDIAHIILIKYASCGSIILF